MTVNGEAIYGTKPWFVTHEGSTEIEMKGTDERERDGCRTDFKEQDFWFTKKNNALYVIALEWPEDDVVTIKSLSNRESISPKIKSVFLLGSETKIEWDQTKDGLSINLLGKRLSEYGYVLKVEMQ
jgi:alpha-L-fucosidase